MSPEGCVGFADCPCSKCRARRVAFTAAHDTGHDHPQDRSYCGVCKTAERNRYAVRR